MSAPNQKDKAAPDKDLEQRIEQLEQSKAEAEAQAEALRGQVETLNAQLLEAKGDEARAEYAREMGQETQELCLVQFAERHGFAGVKSKARGVMQFGSYQAVEGQVANMPVALKDRLVKDRPGLLIVEQKDFQPQTVNRRVLKEDGSGWEVKKEEVAVADLVKRASTIGTMEIHH